MAIDASKTIEPKVDTATLAAHFGVTPRCTQNWRDAGRIPFIRITARCLRYNLSEVEAALSRKKGRY
jgi:predicted site-specific integrase-resolvase